MGLLLALTLGASIGQWLGLPLLSLILSGTIAGVIVGAFQHLALRGEVTRRWIGFSALGGLIGAFPAFVISFTLLLRWELEPAGPGTRLTLRHTVQGREWLPKVAAGWHLCLDVAQHLLDGDPVGPIRGADAVHYGFNELNDAYEREFKEQES